MEQTISLKIKARDIAIGFFGWIIFDNLFVLFILILSINLALPDLGDLGAVYLGLPIVIAPLAFFAKKRTWIGTGIVTAILTSATLSIALGLHGYTILEIIRNAMIPFPSGFLIFISNGYQ